jgi:hypothetical protein
MAFSQTSKDITLDGSKLSAQVKDRQGCWRSSTIDLNDHIGNKDGSFYVDSTNWHASAVSTRLDGTVLRSTLYTIAGSQKEACLELNLFLTNDDGELKFLRLFVYGQVQRFAYIS